MQAQFAHAELVQISVPLPSDGHPWRPLEGAWANHPDAADFEQNLREYRRQVDADSDRL